MGYKFITEPGFFGELFLPKNNNLGSNPNIVIPGSDGSNTPTELNNFPSPSNLREPSAGTKSIGMLIGNTMHKLNPFNWVKSVADQKLEERFFNFRQQNGNQFDNTSLSN